MHRAHPLFLAALAVACGPIVPVLGDGGGDTSTSAGTDDGAPQPSGPSDDGGDPSVPGDPSADGGDAEADDGVVDDSGGDSGTAITCGDGQLDEGERCDDGNDEPGDGCEADCTQTPGWLFWEQFVDGAGDDDAARAVTVSADGEILVVGSMQINGDDVWLRALASDGGVLEEHIVDLGGDEIGTSLAITPEGAVYVAGAQFGADAAVLLRRENGELLAMDGAPVDLTTSTVLASPTAEGFVLVTHAGGFDTLAATVRRYDGGGVVVAELVQPTGVFMGVAIPGPDGGTILGGGSFGGMGTASSVWLSGLGADGSAQWNATMDADPGMSVRIRGLARADDGRIVGVGTLGPAGGGGGGGGGNDDDSGWIWWWSADGQPETDGPLDIGGAQARPNAVVVGTHGLVVGGATVALEDGFVAGFTLEGEIQWGVGVTGDLGLEDRVSALAVVPDVGVVAVGRVAQSGTGEDAWIGLFAE
jgi:cysteine-rich repeat protein